MIIVTFITATGEPVSAQAQSGDSLLAVAQAAGLPLEGTCEGQMACATCHVVVAPEWFGRLPQASADEDDMLYLAAEVRPTSRLACQIVLRPEDDGLTVRIPGESRDMRRG